MSLLGFVRIKLELEDVLHTKVDLVEYKNIKTRLKDRILSEEVRIYCR
jgi:predicted nucleotidyltransferase